MRAARERASRCCTKLGNPRVIRYLERHHREILTDFQAIVAATSLEEGVTTRSEEQAFLG
jgi:hypothetical protein